MSENNVFDNNIRNVKGKIIDLRYHGDEYMKYLKNDYVTYQDKIIFMCNFNKKLDKYYEIISKYNQLIFSDSDNFMKYIYNCSSKIDQFINDDSSKFNKPLDFINKLSHITHLVIGYEFNQPLELSNKLTHLTYKPREGFPIVLTQNIVYLVLGNDYNQPIQLNENLLHLELGNDYNQPIQLNEKLHFLKLNINNQNLLDNLPNSIKTLILGHKIDVELNNLPNSIKFLHIGNSQYKKELNNLPKSLEQLNICTSCDCKINNIPKNLIIFKFNIFNDPY